MPEILITEVTSLNKENPKLPVSNLLIGKKWQPALDDNNKEAVAQFDFKVSSQISYIDVGYFNVATIEIHAVSRFDEHRIILPEHRLQTAEESRENPKKFGCKMFTDKILDSVAKQRKWDRIKIILRQPHTKNKPFGLEFVRIASADCHKENMNVLGNINEANKVTSVPSDKPRNGLFAKNIVNTTSPSRPLTAMERRLFSKVTSPEHNQSAGGVVIGRTAKMVLASRMKNPISQQKDQSRTSKSTNIVFMKPANAASPSRMFTNIMEDQRRNGNEIGSSSKEMSNSSTRMISTSTNNTNTIKDKSTNLIKKHAPRQTPLSLQNNINIINDDESSLCLDNKSSNDCKSAAPTITNKQPPSNVPSTSDVEFLEEVKPPASLTTSDTNDSCQNDLDVMTQQIQSLKLQIKQYLSSLNISSFDLAKVTAKDLRRDFESQIGLKLDKSGREYFRKKTVQLLKKTNNKRKSNETFDESTNSPAKFIKTSKAEETTECPICMREIPSDFIMIHADNCAGLNDETVDLCQSNTDDSTKNIKPAIEIPQSSRVQFVMCPICAGSFSSSDITEHANNCAELSIVTTNEYGTDDVIASTSHSSNHVVVPTSPAVRRVHQGEMIIHGDEKMMTEEEKKHWEEFRSRPKAFHPRINRSAFDGQHLVKCPTCGQHYKKCDIMEHSDECAEKVNSGLSKRGLYFVKE